MRTAFNFVLLSIFSSLLMGQSPHGTNFNLDCAMCHQPENWSYSGQKASFDHNTTLFPLNGAHVDVKCRSCHTSLDFKSTKENCNACHVDIHQQTVGLDCGRCHNTLTWVVEQVTRLHEQVSFPLIGAHASTDCNLCHKSETLLRFDPIGPECIKCHQAEYDQAQIPDHKAQKFPVDCSLCHRQTEMDWKSGEIVHSFFPLELGHNIKDCTVCHKSSIYSTIDGACINCHSDDKKMVTKPDHSLFPDECNLCHGLNIGWKPASFSTHDATFPIYSGNHKGEWNQCTECHLEEGNYSNFSCVNCHEHNNSSKLAKEHDDVNGYTYESKACFHCHPRGN